MQKFRRCLSPNCQETEIDVQFVVIHHTAVSLFETLEIFIDPKREVSSHLVIGEAGELYEVVPCLKVPPQRAWHAGVSRYEYGGRTIEGFNDFSIGIELVNLDGNIYPYPESQIDTLIAVLREFQSRFPILRDPSRILGHEEISGFRGKIDPGKLFPWERVKRELSCN